MPFFRALFHGTPETDSDASRVAMVLSDNDLVALESLLGKVAYEHAEPVMRALRAAAAMQRNAGLCEIVEQVLELHRTALEYRDQSSTEETFH